MKKIAVSFFVLFMTLPFVVIANETPPNMDIGSMLIGGTLPVFSTLPDDQKAKIMEEAAKEGTEITFNDDGTTTIKASDGTVVVQQTDGTMNYIDEQGKKGNLGMGEWPDNEFTRLVPKPDMTISAVVTEDDNLAVLFASPTIEQLRAYAEKVKEAGFDIDAETDEQKVGNMEIFMYTATNIDGIEVEIFSAMGASGMTLEK